MVNHGELKEKKEKVDELIRDAEETLKLRSDKTMTAEELAEELGEDKCMVEYALTKSNKIRMDHITVPEYRELIDGSKYCHGVDYEVWKYALLGKDTKETIEELIVLVFVVLGVAFVMFLALKA